MVRTFFSWAVPVVVATVVAGCGGGENPVQPGQQQTATPGATTTTTQAAATTTSPTTTTKATDGAAAPAYAGPKTGILAVTDDSAHRTYGLIDPDTGKYSEVASFPIPDNNRGIPFNNLVLSPDLTKLAVAELIDGNVSAGWIDAQGNFTSATPPATDAGPFGGTPPSYTVVGFDGAGNYYYQASSQGSVHPQMFRLAAGSTSNPEEITDKGAQQSELNAYRNFDGTMQFGCSDILSWMGPNAIVFVAGGANQIVIRPITGTDARGCPEFRGTDADVLPSSNTNAVRNAVGSPDASRVAFKLDDPNGGPNHTGAQVVYTVGADGSSEPKALDVTELTGLRMAGTTLLAWI